MRALLPLFTLLISASAYASDWVFVTDTDDETIFVDKSSIVQIGKYKKAWVWHDGKSARFLDSSSSFDTYLSTLELSLARCDERTSSYIRDIYYEKSSMKGKVVYSYGEELSKAKFQDVVPNSVGENIFNYICRKNHSK